MKRKIKRELNEEREKEREKDGCRGKRDQGSFTMDLFLTMTMIKHTS